MRKVVLQMMTTLNGRLDDPGAWVSDIPDDLYSEINRAYEKFDVLLVGQTTYEELAGYWPSAETEEGGSENNKSMARKMNSYKKYVFSRADEKKTLEWNNVEQVLVHTDDDMTRFIHDLKTQSGGDLHLVGGARFAQSIVRLGLVDEYRLFVYPIVSMGASWFQEMDEKRELDLLSAKTYENGVVGLYYTPKIK